MIGRVDALQVELFMHRCSQCSKFRLVQQRHDKQRGSGVEMMPIPAEAVAAPAGVGVFLHHRDLQASLGQVDGGGDSTHARADDQHRFCFHALPCRCEANGHDTLLSPPQPNKDTSASQAIFSPVPRLLRSWYSERRI